MRAERRAYSINTHPAPVVERHESAQCLDYRLLSVGFYVIPPRTRVANKRRQQSSVQQYRCCSEVLHKSCDQMNLYGDLPPAQGETPNDSVAAWKPSSSKAPSSTSTIPGNKPGGKPVLAFKPRQATQPVQSLKTAASTSLSVPLVEKNAAQFSVATLQSSDPNTVSERRLVSTIAGASSFVTAKSNATPSGEQEFNHNSNFDVIDAYDPRVPNEYIAYCEERLEKRRLVRVEEENRRVMAEAERARADLEQERRAASNRGDYQSLLMLSASSQGQGGPDTVGGGNPQGGVGTGRGRGRGLVNLPAWMTQQLAMPPVEPAAVLTLSGGAAVDSARYQDAQQPGGHVPSGDAQAAAVAVGVKRKQTSQFNKPSPVLLLKNMVGPEEVDDQLGPETQQECQKYGPVASCEVFALPPSLAGLRCPDEERVRTFVEFHSQESAVRAFRDMNGRFFGGRQIAASFFAEDRYHGRNLAPDATERAAWV